MYASLNCPNHALYKSYLCTYQGLRMVGWAWEHAWGNEDWRRRHDFFHKILATRWGSSLVEHGEEKS